MAIAQTPSFTPASGYRPVIWALATFFDITVGTITTARITLRLDGTQIAVDNVRPYAVLGFGPFFTYLFRVDVQDFFQRKKGPDRRKTNIFGTLGAQYNADATDAYGRIDIDAEYFYTDAITGLPVNQGVLDTTTAWPIFDATRQHEESMALTAYVPDVGALAPSLWLTKAPFIQNICLQNSLFLNSIHGDASFLRVSTYDGQNGSGALIDEGFLVFPASGYNSQVALGVGPEEIRATTFTSGSVNIDNPLVKSYRLTLGQGNSPMIPLSQSYFFNLIACCQDGFERLHFLNRLGGTDAFTFKSLNIETQVTTSDIAQKPLDWDINTPLDPHNLSDRGAFRIDVRAVVNRQLETPGLTPEFTEWLSELLSTPDAYLETPEGLLPVIISDLEQDLETNTDSELPLLRFSISARDANERIIQRN